MSTDNELKSVPGPYSGRNLLVRYQAFIATIVSAFLFINLFQVLFSNNESGPPNESGRYECGSLFRPLLRSPGDSDPGGWLWSSNPFSVDKDVICYRTMYSLWWELLATLVALAICALVIRRAIKRENASA